MNPLDPCTLVIIGATGNLSRVKLMPGLFRLELAGRLPEKMVILSIYRSPFSRAEWQKEIKGMLEAKFPEGLDKEALTRFMNRTRYHGHGNPPDDATSYERLRDTLSDTKIYPSNIVFFLSIRPSDFSNVVDSLAGVGLLKEDKGWRNVVVEKPFGTDLVSSQAGDRQPRRHAASGRERDHHDDGPRDVGRPRRRSPRAAPGRGRRRRQRADRSADRPEGRGGRIAHVQPDAPQQHPARHDVHVLHPAARRLAGQRPARGLEPGHQPEGRRGQHRERHRQRRLARHVGQL